MAQKIIADKDKRIEEMTPKADYFDALVDRNLLTNFRDTAKELEIKEREFIKWLLDKGYVYRHFPSNILKLYAEYVNGKKKYFEIKEYQRERHAGTQTLITPYAREAFRLLLGR